MDKQEYECLVCDLTTIDLLHYGLFKRKAMLSNFHRKVVNDYALFM
jgi:hypothetical protein